MQCFRHGPRVPTHAGMSLASAATCYARRLCTGSPAGLRHHLSRGHNLCWQLGAPSLGCWAPPEEDRPPAARLSPRPGSASLSGLGKWQRIRTYEGLASRDPRQWLSLMCRVRPQNGSMPRCLSGQVSLHFSVSIIQSGPVE